MKKFLPVIATIKTGACLCFTAWAAVWGVLALVFWPDAVSYTHLFSRAICEMLFHVDFHPDIIHANDWQTALVPVYLNPVSYTHLDVYKRQGLDSAAKARAARFVTAQARGRAVVCVTHDLGDARLLEAHLSLIHI